MGVNADGRRELLGLKVGDSESEPFWREFLASLKQRQGQLKVRHRSAGAAMLVPVLSGLLPSVGRPRCHC